MLLGFFSGVLFVVLGHWFQRYSRPLAVFISWLAASIGLVVWGGLAGVIFDFLANTAETRDMLGRIFLIAFVVGITVAVIYWRYQEYRRR